jgi:iron complex outermembrane receptor protein
MRILTLLTVLLVSLTTFGQDTKVDTIHLDGDSRLLFSESPITDTTMVVDLQSVTVTGIRLDPKQPITNDVITAETISAEYRGQEITYIVAKTPSITIQSDGGHEQGYTTFRLRGIDQTRLNFTLNGCPLNEPEDQGVYFSNIPMFAQNIHSLQIQRGVGTTANGTSSYGGSLNFESKSGYKKGGVVGLTYGSFNTTLLHANYSTGLVANNKLSFFTSAGIQRYDGYKEHSGGRGYSFFLGGQYYGKTSRIKLTAFSGASNNQMAWFAVSESDIKANPRTNYNSPDDDDNFRQSMVQLQYVEEFNPVSKLTTTAYYNRLDGEWDLSVGDRLNFQLSSDFIGGMMNYSVDWDLLTINVGVHGNHYVRRHAMAIIPDVETTLYENRGIKNSGSGFTKVGINVGRFSILADVEARYVEFDYFGTVDFRKETWMFINPKGGIVYNQSDKLRFYFYVGHSNREPTRTDMLGGEDDLVEYTLKKPESVIDYELGSQFAIPNKFNLNLNLFFMDFNNEITLAGALGSNSLPLMTNVANSFRSGIEFDITYTPHKNLLIGNTTTFAWNRITNNYGGSIGIVHTQPLYSPWLVLNQSVRYTFKNFFVGVEGVYNGKSYMDFENKYEIPDFFLLNANVGYTLKLVTLKLDLRNITDQQYFTNGYVVNNERNFFVNAPFSLFAGVNITF